jgi:hypothetical protein
MGGVVRRVYDMFGMLWGFLLCGRGRVLLMPAGFCGWLAANHLVWFVLSLVVAMGVASFCGSYRSDAHGCPAHDRGMMAWAQPVVATRCGG